MTLLKFKRCRDVQEFSAISPALLPYTGRSVILILAYAMHFLCLHGWGTNNKVCFRVL